MSQPRLTMGFTLLELVTALAVAAILILMATPSFGTMAERTALRGVSDNLTGVIVTAKEEAIKRDALVRVDFKAMGNAVCIGASTNVASGCDCATNASACGVAVWPEQERDLHRVTLLRAPSFGDDAAFIVDPKTGTLSDVADVGSVVVGTERFAVQVQVNAMARASRCTPSVAGKEGISGLEAC